MHGVQFHPESIASEHGHALLQAIFWIRDEGPRMSDALKPLIGAAADQWSPDPRTQAEQAFQVSSLRARRRPVRSAGC